MRRTHQGLSWRRLLGSLEQLRVTRLLNVEHRGSSRHCTSCINGGTSSAHQDAAIAEAAAAVTHVQSQSREVGSGDEGLGLLCFDLSSAETDFWWLENEQ